MYQPPQSLCLPLFLWISLSSCLSPSPAVSLWVSLFFSCTCLSFPRYLLPSRPFYPQFLSFTILLPRSLSAPSSLFKASFSLARPCPYPQFLSLPALHFVPSPPFLRRKDSDPLIPGSFRIGGPLLSSPWQLLSDGLTVPKTRLSPKLTK